MRCSGDGEIGRENSIGVPGWRSTPIFEEEPSLGEGDGRDMYYVIWTLTGKENIVRDEILAQIGAEYNSRIHILTRERKQKYRGEWQMR